MEQATRSNFVHRLVPRRRTLVILLIAVVLGFCAFLVFGSLRYDGIDGLAMRVRAELPANTDHPQFVPTPLSAGAGNSARALALAPTRALTAAAPSSTATPTATPTRQPANTPIAEAAVADMGRAAFGMLTRTPTPSPTATPEPTATPIPTDTPPPPPTEAPPASGAPASFVSLSGINHYWQTWNNCGPSTLAMYLSYYDMPLTQAQTAKALKPDKNDKNVSPDQIAAFAQSQGLHAVYRVHGKPEMVRRLLDAGIPVMVETWMDHDGGMGHYRLITGYDDAHSQWVLYDSFISEGVDPNNYQGIRMSYEALAKRWRVFNDAYVLVYDDSRAQAVQEIVGDELDDATMWRRSLEQAQADVQQNQGDPYAWFNLGSSLAAQGNYADAATAFDQARVIGLPWRMLWYQFGAFKSYYETGRFDELLALADSTIAPGGNIEEHFYWRGKALQAKGDVEGARQAYKRAFELNTNYAEAAAALAEVGG